ncbi:MAG: hypothetical protein ACFB16_20335, partial [Phormidesmis sp.]
RTVEKYDYNTEKARDAINRIKQAVLKLATGGELADGIGKRKDQICRLARTSAKTLYKNLHLWHTDHWCVTAGTASNTGNLAPPPPPDPDRFKRLICGLLHTKPPLMKCGHLEIPLLKIFNPDSWGSDGGPGEDGGFQQADGAS